MKIYAKSKLSKNIYDKINKGADGIEYEFTRDVNLLRGYTEETMAP